MAEDIIKAAADLAVVLDESGNVEKVHFGEPYAGEKSDDWLGRPWTELVSGATRHKIEELLEEARQEGVSRGRQVNHELPSGRQVPVRYTTVRLGKSGKILAIGRDLGSLSQLQSRLVEAQQAMERDYWRMRHIETRYRLLFQASSDVVLLVNAETRSVQDANPAAAELFGTTVSELVDRRFPFGVEGEQARQLEEHLAAVRTQGDADAVRLDFEIDGEPVACSVRGSLLRQDDAPSFLIRIQRVDDEEVGDRPAGTARAAALRLLQGLPDAVVITDGRGRIAEANEAFLEMVQVASRDKVAGENIERWVGLPGAEGDVLFSMLDAHGVLRLFPTMLNGELGSETEVEVSAVVSDSSDSHSQTAVFVIRDVGRRLAGRREVAERLEDVVEQFANLVGRVTLKEFVKDTVGVVEREFIERALEMTGGNRTAAAELLGLSRQSLYAKLDRYDLKHVEWHG